MAKKIKRSSVSAIFVEDSTKPVYGPFTKLVFDPSTGAVIPQFLPKAPETGEEMILRFEQECHCRVDSNGFDNFAVAGLMGAMARVLGKSNHRAEDDVIAGALIQHNVSPEGQRQQRADMRLADLMRMGVDPNDLYEMHKVLHPTKPDTDKEQPAVKPPKEGYDI